VFGRRDDDIGAEHPEFAGQLIGRIQVQIDQRCADSRATGHSKDRQSEPAAACIQQSPKNTPEHFWIAQSRRALEADLFAA